jgi:hypothetical protein
MEEMDTAAVAAWFTDVLELPQYAAFISEHAVDGDMLLDLADRDYLSELEVTSVLHEAKIRAALAKLRRKAAAEGAAAGMDVARVKRPRVEPAIRATPGTAPAPVPAVLAKEQTQERAPTPVFKQTSTESCFTSPSQVKRCSAWSASTRLPNIRPAARVMRRAAAPSFAAAAWSARSE